MWYASSFSLQSSILCHFRILDLYRVAKTKYIFFLVVAGHLSRRLNVSCVKIFFFIFPLTAISTESEKLKTIKRHFPRLLHPSLQSCSVASRDFFQDLTQLHFRDKNEPKSMSSLLYHSAVCPHKLKKHGKLNFILLNEWISRPKLTILSLFKQA